MSRVSIRLLGHLTVTFEGTERPFGGSERTAALLGYLVARSGEATSRQALAALMFPDSDPEEGRAKLRRQLYLLAHALPAEVDYFDSKARSLRWAPSEPVWIDALEFERAAADPARTQEAIECYRGDFLENSYEDWALLERERLQGTFLKLCYDAAVAARRRRDFDAMLAYAERILGVDEWREDALRLEMTARYDAGDRTGALAAFERFASSLKREMHVDPMPETLVLRAAILQNAPLPGQREFEEDDADDRSPRAKLPFVGRNLELETLGAAWQRAARGRGSTVFLSGQAGIGKSRLVAELVTTATAQGGRTSFGGTSNPEAFPYEAIVDALRTSIALISEPRIDRAWLASLSALLPELRGILPDLPHVDVSDGDRARERLLEAVARIVESLAAARPLLLVVEDAHWAGTATLDALEAIARRIGALPVLLLVTYRTDETGPAHALRALRKRLQAERRATSLSLGALSREDVAKIVATAHPHAPRELGEAVHALSEGNPLFVVHLLGGIKQGDTAPDETMAARSLASVIRARIAELVEPARVVAETGATIGRSFTAEAIAHVLAWPESEVTERIDELLDRGILREAGATRLAYTFTHALIAAAIYDAVPQEVRQARHRRIAQMLERAAPTEPVEPATVARHWSLARDDDRAAAAYVKAAEAALAVFARDEASALVALGRDLAKKDATRFEAVRVACAIGAATADVAGWNADIEELEELGARIDDAHTMVALQQRRRYARQTANVAMQERTIAAIEAIANRSGLDVDTYHARTARGVLHMQLAEVEAAIESFTAAIGFAGTDMERFLGLEHLVTAYARHDDIARARAGLIELRAICDRLGSPAQVRVNLLSSEATIAMVTEDGPWMETIGRELVEAAPMVGDLFQEGKGYGLIGQGAFWRSDFETFRSNYERAIELFAQIGEADAVRVSYANMADVERRIGRSQRALELCEMSERYRGAAAGTDDILLGNSRACAFLELGRIEEALECARSATRAALATSEIRFIDESLAVLGRAELRAGLLDDALEHLTRAASLAREREGWLSLAEVLIDTVLAQIAAGHDAAAIAAGKELEALFERDPRAGEPSFACVALARSAQAAGDTAAQAAWLERGRAALDEALSKLADPADRQAFAALEYHRMLLEPHRNAQP